MSELSSIEVFDVGLSQYRDFLRDGLYSVMPYPRVGDYLIVYTNTWFGYPHNYVVQHETFENHITDLNYALEVANSIYETNLQGLVSGLLIVAHHIEVWHVVDDMPLTDTGTLHLQGPCCAVCGDRYDSYYLVRGPLGLFQLCTDCHKGYRTVVTKLASACEVR